MNPNRYHVTLAVDGRPMMQGWWGSEAVARSKFREWVGGRGGVGATVTLVDEETGAVLTAWPEDE